MKNESQGSLLEKKLADNQRIRIAGKKFHIPKSIPTSIITFIISLILLPIILSATFMLIEYLSGIVIWYLKNTSSDVVYYMIAGTIVSWLFCLVHMIFKKGEVLESIVDCTENMLILTYTIVYIVVIIFKIIDNGASLTFEFLFQLLIQAIMALFSTLAWTLVATLIGLFVVVILSFLMRGIFKRLILYVELTKARKSRCYKALCYLIKDYDFDQTKSIDYIFITNDRINVIDDDQEIQEIIFKEHKLPDLTQYGIAAMACLIKLRNPYFRIKSDILGLTLINTNLETQLLDERTVEIKLDEVAKMSEEIKKKKSFFAKIKPPIFNKISESPKTVKTVKKVTKNKNNSLKNKDSKQKKNKNNSPKDKKKKSTVK